VWVCLGLLNAETGQLVLAGDPKQLGPILRSPFAIKYGLGEIQMNAHTVYSEVEFPYAPDLS